MVVIRLSRKGTNKRPFYHVVAADSRFSRDGRNIEKLGYFNPIAAGKEKRLFLNLERVEYWVSVGAKPSDRVVSLLSEAKKIPDVTAPQKPTYKKHATGPNKPLQVTTSGDEAKAKKASAKPDVKKPVAKKPAAKKPAPKKAASAKTE